ncbi:MAG: D-aminoacyl-tRNA deacylase, partial [Deltaproteobacteria bacterium]|nr:D-aminoacyl-tRNA deacylase [Deltaproteobacteria bacterium]
AASPEEAEELYDYFVKKLQERGLKVATGQFQAKMEVTLINSGPVTFILDSE